MSKLQKRLYEASVIILLVVVLLGFIPDKSDEIKEVTYNEFLQMVSQHKVDTVYYNATEEKMTFTLYNKETKNMSDEELKDYKYENKDKRWTYYPAYEDFRKDMLTANVKLSVNKTKSMLTSILTFLVQLGLYIGILYFLFRKLGGVGKGVNKNHIMQTSNVTFDDVIGQDEILDDIRFIADLIKNPKKGQDIGASIPKGILLSGEPGTGKTLIAKAIAGEAGVPFLTMNASSFVELYVGNGAKKVRELFKIARDNAPCILFIDEIDAVGKKRGNRGGNNETDQTINEILTEMDGFTGREGVFVIAATNRPDVLDDALVRAGRFDREIVVRPPRDWKVRKEIFEHYLANYKLSDDINLENLCRQITGFTGADIATLCNDASIIAMMKDKSYIDNDCLEEAIDQKVFKGNRSKKEEYIEDKKIVAYHESGHAIMSYLLKQPIARASIIGTTSGVGGAVFHTDSDSVFITDIELKNRVLIAYAGRASEEIKFEKVTSGASSDIHQATNIMLNYIEKYGFDKDFGLLDMQVLSDRSVLENGDIVKRLSKMSKDLYTECFDMLKSNYDKVEILANKLLEVETMNGDEILELLKD